jgi:hypothetical protein
VLGVDRQCDRRVRTQRSEAGRGVTDADVGTSDIGAHDDLSAVPLEPRGDNSRRTVGRDERQPGRRAEQLLGEVGLQEPNVTLGKRSRVFRGLVAGHGHGLSSSGLGRWFADERALDADQAVLR